MENISNIHNNEDFTELIKDFLDINSPNNELIKDLGDFLVKNGKITSISHHKNWGFKYENGEILIGTIMNQSQYNKYIVQLGISSETGEKLFPDINQSSFYRFLHETSHAYQEYLEEKELKNQIGDYSGGTSEWCNAVLNNQINSTYAELWKYCYENRERNKGFSTWGNVPDYNYENWNGNLKSELSVRAIEDANELVTMYLWNPEYFETFLDYIAGDLPGTNDIYLHNDGLRKISQTEKNNLNILVTRYIMEMEDNITRDKSGQQKIKSVSNKIKGFFNNII